jgi:hypothetical protein
LIAFRRGLAADGHVFYSRAIEHAARHGLREAGAAAVLYYAREVARAEPKHRTRSILEARPALDLFTGPLRHVYAEVLARIEEGRT